MIFPVLSELHIPGARSAESENEAEALQSLLEELQNKIRPRLGQAGVGKNELLTLVWPEPPRNILLVKKDFSQAVSNALIEFANHVKASYPTVNILLEYQTANETHKHLSFPVYADTGSHLGSEALHEKVDLVSTFGGDGTILHASSLFSTSLDVPPILSFSMGTLGFLGEWKFSEYKRAFREVFMSGALDRQSSKEQHSRGSPSRFTAWATAQAKAMGVSRNARVLTRNRLKVGIHAPDGSRARMNETGTIGGEVHAMNEVILHRGQDPHLAIIELFVGGRFLTEAVADGMIISTPTGSTAYSLSSGGSIVHPLVSSLLLTPICPRSLSFRPLVLPATTPVTLRLSEKNRGREIEVSVDGVRRNECIGVGMEVRVSGEAIRNTAEEQQGGVPCIMRRTAGVGESDDGWVGGLNGLLKFNYPFGEEN
ncbi:MAG: hypothetical protein Q9227_009297 [Pyrenula ochraceoflavens]